VFYSAVASAAEIAKHQISLDILSSALSLTVLTAVLTVATGCIVAMLIQGPAYVADGYELEDADSSS